MNTVFILYNQNQIKSTININDIILKYMNIFTKSSICATIQIKKHKEGGNSNAQQTIRVGF